MLKDRYSTPKRFTFHALQYVNIFGICSYKSNKCNLYFIISFEFTQSNPDEHFVYLLFKIHFPLTKNDLPLQLNAISKCPSVLRFRRKEKT